MSRTGWLAVVWLGLVTPASAISPHRPCVTASNPKDGQVGVGPGLKTVAVTFNRRMSTRSDGWSGHGPSYPTVRGRSYWDQDRRTCTLPVRLSPGRCYVVGINEGSETGFEGRHGARALPYTIVFATRGFDTGATALPFAWVKQTVPRCGASEVAPGRSTLDIGLSRPVKGGAGPWQRYGPVVPRMLSLPAFSDDGDAVRMSVMLRAACDYAIDIHSRCHPGLAARNGEYLLPYWLAFRTADHRGQGRCDRPVVVGSDPPMGDESVDPTRTTLRLEFSVPLRGGPVRMDRYRAEMPDIVVPPRVTADPRRCKLGVRLKPNTVYVLGVNLRTPKTFHSVAGRPAVPFVWAFATRRTPTPAKTIPYPRVVGISPRHRADDVSPSIKQLRIVFSEPMSPGYSVMAEGGSCPSPIGRPVWSPDRRTITWPVQHSAWKGCTITGSDQMRPSSALARNMMPEPPSRPGCPQGKSRWSL